MASARYAFSQVRCNQDCSIGAWESLRERYTENYVERAEIKGVRRKHQCLVTTVARVSMSGAKECSNGKPFQIMVARAIAAQVVQAVAGLHSRGVVHGGR